MTLQEIVLKLVAVTYFMTITLWLFNLFDLSNYPPSHFKLNLTPIPPINSSNTSTFPSKRLHIQKLPPDTSFLDIQAVLKSMASWIRIKTKYHIG